MIPLRDANPTRRTPVVTIALIGACFAGFAWELGVLATGGEPALGRFIREHGLVPREIVAAAREGVLDSSATMSLLTHLFLHGSWLHLLGNVLYLWIFGNNVEDRVGRPGFLAFYLFGGLAAAAAQVVVEPGSALPLVGASGAIASALGAYLVLFPRARILSLVFLGFFYQLIQVPALLVLGFWFVLQLIDGVTSLGVPNVEGGVAFFAHIGGFVAGVGVGLLLRGRGRGSLRAATVG